MRRECENAVLSHDIKHLRVISCINFILDIPHLLLIFHSYFWHPFLLDILKLLVIFLTYLWIRHDIWDPTFVLDSSYLLLVFLPIQYLTFHMINLLLAFQTVGARICNQPVRARSVNYLSLCMGWSIKFVLSYTQFLPPKNLFCMIDAPNFTKFPSKFTMWECCQIPDDVPPLSLLCWYLSYTLFTPLFCKDLSSLIRMLRADREDADGWVVSAGVSVTWNVLSWSGGHEFESWLGWTWGG